MIRDFVLKIAEEEALKEFTPEQIAKAKSDYNKNKCRSDGRSCDCGWSWDGGENLDFPAPCPESKTR